MHENQAAPAASETAVERPSILLADDHQLVAEGLAKILDPVSRIVGMVTNGRALVTAAASLNPDVIVADIGLPVISGIEAAREIRKNNPDARIVFVTMHPEPLYIREAFDAGGSAYVLKQSASRELLDAVRAVLRGEVFLSSGIAPDFSESLATVTSRQREVLRRLAEGMTAKEIAHALKVSVKTVEFHKAAIKERLGIHTSAQLIRYALERGML